MKLLDIEGCIVTVDAMNCQKEVVEVRKHWGIENSPHWCKDVAFREDNSRIRKDHSAENMAVVRHIALNILKYLAKISLVRKRRRCAYDDAFLADVVASVRA